MRTKNLRTMQMSSTSGGVEASESSMLKGEASTTKAEKETNSTTQYETGSVEKGPLGGKPSGQ